MYDIKMKFNKFVQNMQTKNKPKFDKEALEKSIKTKNKAVKDGKKIDKNGEN
jgi:hypothetical protein